METAAVAAFLIVHGFVHAMVWVPKSPAADAPFDPGHSWLLDGAHVALPTERTVSAATAWIVAGLYLVAAALLVAGAAWWGTVAVAAAAVGIALKTAFFNPWLSLGVLLDVAVIVAVLAQWPAALF
jgi:hypothetical protein